MSTYQGMFVRQALGDTPSSSPPTDWTTSPDVIIAGPTPAADPSVYAASGNYGTSYGTNLTSGQVNYVYVRALNATSGSWTARIWLFYVDNNMAPFADGWTSNGISVNGAAVNYCTVSATSANQIVVSAPFVVQTPPVTQNQSWDLIALVENQPLSKPPEANVPQNMTSWAELGQWAGQNYGQVGWVSSTPATGWGQTWQTSATFQTGTYSGELFVGALCSNMPTDGFLAVTMPGPAGCTLNLAKTAIANGNGMYGSMLQAPAGFPGSTVTITYWQGGTTPPAGASITPQALIPVGPLTNLPTVS